MIVICHSQPAPSTNANVLLETSGNPGRTCPVDKQLHVNTGWLLVARVGLETRIRQLHCQEPKSFSTVKIQITEENEQSVAS